MTPRQRVETVLQHKIADRVPVDFLATPEIWKRLLDRLQIDHAELTIEDYYDPSWEVVLQKLEVDCRVISYDQFYQPPESALHNGAMIDWYSSLGRSTPNRMWRQFTPEGTIFDIWGHQTKVVSHSAGAYEEISSYPLEAAQSVSDLQVHLWPNPDWWDFTHLPEVLGKLDPSHKYHIRYRVGSIFETAWQLRGLQAFMRDLALEPSIPMYLMERITDILVENTHRALSLASDHIDMLYFYDDIATQQSLMISPRMWEKYVKPWHQRIIEVAKKFEKPVMYHCDGSIYQLIPALIDMGITLLNPIQADAKDMQPERLKKEFGAQMSFHGGIDIIKTLPHGSTTQVQAEVLERMHVLGENGGYIMASSHHIQSDTPLENIFAMYDIGLR